MSNAGFTVALSRSIWCAIVYDNQRRKRDYRDGFDSAEHAQLWLLLNLRHGERGELRPGHTLRATGEARYYKEGGRLLQLQDHPVTAGAAREDWWGQLYGDFV